MGFCTANFAASQKSISNVPGYLRPQDAYLCEKQRSTRSSHAFPGSWSKLISV